MRSYKEAFAKFKQRNSHVIAYRNRRWAGLVAKCLLLSGVIAAVAFLLLKNQPALIPVGILIAEGLLLWRMKPWRCFKRGWIGAVESVKYEVRYENVDKKLFNPFYGGKEHFTYLHFAVRDERSKKHTFVLDRKFETIYQIGDLVMNIPGIDYPIDLTVQDKKVCPRCGSIYPSINERCVSIGCGMPATELDENDQINLTIKGDLL